MNRLTFSLLTFLAVFCFANCSENKPAPEAESDGMAKFTKDEDFKNAHETPEDIAFEGKGEMMEFRTPNGSLAKAYRLKPAETSTKFLLVIHEWWGLNDHIKQEAERLFDELGGGVDVMALDLYDGKMATDPDEAGKLMNAVKPERCENIIKGALAIAGKDGEVATIGWCFGGGWSLRSSILAAERGVGCVMYYGMPVEKPAELVPLRADVLGIFAKKDGWITPEVIGKFEDLAKATGKNVRAQWYDAEHAFANPTSPRYNEEAAQKANAEALAFLKEKLK